jgi:hypothetical protein
VSWEVCGSVKDFRRGPLTPLSPESFSEVVRRVLLRGVGQGDFRDTRLSWFRFFTSLLDVLVAAILVR